MLVMWQRGLNTGLFGCKASKANRAIHPALVLPRFCRQTAEATMSAVVVCSGAVLLLVQCATFL